MMTFFHRLRTASQCLRRTRDRNSWITFKKILNAALMITVPVGDEDAS